MTKDTIREERLRKRRALEAMGVDPYGGRFETDGSLDACLQRLLAAEEAAAGEEAAPDPLPVRAAGRIVAIRDMGKSVWLDLRDRSLEKLQVNLMKKRCPEIFDQFQHVDIGDFLGVEGGLQRSRKGEPTIFAERFTLLCKSLEPLPEKWHGLRDTEVRYRRRYLDLISNRESLETFVARSRIVSTVRRYLDERDFLEVETPMLQSIYGGAAARPFTTHLNALDLDLFLRISPETPLKRLLVGGLDRVYEINRNFRNEGVDPTHNPEFTMLELYQAYGDFEVMMELTEALVAACAEEVLGSLTVPWGEGEEAVTLDFTPPWPRLRFLDGLREHGIAPENEEDCRARLAALLAGEQRKHEGGADEEALRRRVDALDRDHVLAELFGELVEPALVQPTFVTHFPTGLTPLCRASREDPSVHDRFEVIVAGMEIANAYSEQNDPLAQREAFLRQLEVRDADGAAYANDLDEDFCAALEVGMPPAGGLGVGIDRLVMLLTNKPNVREVILFPTLKPRSAAELAGEEEARELADEDREEE
jgi:lysyl-tRNA synthetase class 2